MKLNYLLCKYLDTEKKGYVTLWDAVSNEYVRGSIAVYLIVWFVSMSLSVYLQLPFTKTNPPTDSSILFIYTVSIKPIIEIVYLFLVYVLPYLIVLAIIIYLLYRISKIRIAKCPLTKENKP